MQDLSKIETARYEPAKQFEYSIKDYLLCALKILTALCFGICKYSMSLLKDFVHSFGRPKFKNISGQLAVGKLRNLWISNEFEDVFL